jgi:hypothetical protein
MANRDGACGVCELRFEEPIDLSTIGYLAGTLAVNEVLNAEVSDRVSKWVRAIKGFTAPVYNQKATSLARLFALLEVNILNPAERAVFEKFICFVQLSEMSDAQSDYNNSVTKAIASAAYTGVATDRVTQFSADITQYFCNVNRTPPVPAVV